MDRGRGARDKERRERVKRCMKRTYNGSLSVYQCSMGDTGRRRILFDFMGFTMNNDVINSKSDIKKGVVLLYVSLRAIISPQMMKSKKKK